MSNGKPESYVPGPESTLAIQNQVRRETKVGRAKNIPGAEGPFINPVFIMAGTLLEMMNRGGDARLIKQLTNQFNKLADYQGHVGTSWTLLSMEHSGAQIIRNVLDVPTMPLSPATRGIDFDTKVFIRDCVTSQINHGIGKKDYWGDQLEIFPREAYEDENSIVGLSFRSPARRWLDWKQKVIQSGGVIYPEAPKPLIEAENFFALIESEPRIEKWGQQPTIDQLVTTASGRLSLRKLSSLSPAEFAEQVNINSFTEFITGLLSTESAFRSHVAKLVFLSPAQLYFDESEERAPLRTEAFLSIVSFWRDAIVSDLVTPGEGTNDKILTDFIKKLNAKDGSELFGAGLATRVFGTYLQQAFGEKDLGIGGVGPLIDEANHYFGKTRGRGALAGPYERGYVAVGERLNPLLVQRLEELGLDEQFKLVTDGLGCKGTWDEVSGHQIDKYLTDNNRQGVVEFGAQKELQIEEVSRKIWSKVENGVHYLQDSGQENIIHLEHASIAARAGLHTIALVRSLEPDWQMNVLFQYEGSISTPMVGGHVDRSGRLVLRSDIKDRQPGYFSLLENIALSSIYDLVKKAEGGQVNAQVERAQDDDSPKTKDTTDQQGTQSGTRLISLPRRSRNGESKSENEESPKVEFSTRHVEGHPTTLQGGKKLESEYKDWTNLYLDELLAAPVEQRADITSSYQEVIRGLDAEAHKISTGKENNIPFGMKLKAIIMPFSSDKEGVHICFPVRKTETWTIPHVSPALTDEERASLPASFEKRFRGNGSQWLEWLEYMYLEGIQ